MVMDHGYNFLVLTDHKTITIPQKFWTLKDTSFLFIPGEEVQGYGNKEELEINALNLHKAVQPLNNSTVLGTLRIVSMQSGNRVAFHQLTIRIKIAGSEEMFY